MSALLQQLTGQTKEVERANQSLADIVASSTASINDITGQLANLGTGRDSRGETELSVRVKAQGALDTQIENQKLYAALGMDKEGMAKTSLALAADWQKKIDVRDQQAQVVADKASVGLFDNPIEFLWNQVTLPDEKNKLAATNMLVKNSEAKMQELNTLLQTSAATEAAYAKTLDQAVVADLSRATAADIQQKDYLTQISAYSTNAQQAHAAMQANEIKLNDTNRLLNAQHAEQSLAVQQGQLAVAQGNLALHKKSVDLALSKWDDDVANQKALLNGLNVGLVNSGHEAITDITKAKALLNMPGAEGERFRGYASFGLTKLQDGQFSYGTGPVEVLDTMGKLQPRLTQEQVQLKGEMEKVIQQVSTKVSKDNLGQFTAATNKAWAERWKELNSEITSSSPLKAPPITYMSQQAALAASPVWQKVFAPLAAVPGGLPNNMDDTRILSTLQAAVDSKIISPTEAGSFVSSYYTAAVDQTNKQLDPVKFGGAPQTSYNVRVPSKWAPEGRNLESTGHGIMLAGGAAALAPGVGWPVAGALAAVGGATSYYGKQMQGMNTLNLLRAEDATFYFNANSAVRIQQGQGSIFGLGDSAVKPFVQVGKPQVK